MDLQTFLIGAVIFLGAAVILVPIAHRLGLGSVLGYLFAGILIGPVFGLVKDTVALQHFGEFGVVLMLFIVGLELKPSMLWNLKVPILGTGGAQVGITTLLITGVAILLGQPWQYALAIGLILALSSTAIVLQSLNERGLMKTSGGQSIFSVLLFQDIAIIPMLALMPLLATLPAVQQVSDTESEHASIALHLSAPMQALATFAAVAIIIVGGRYLLRPVFRAIAKTRIRELFIATSLFLVFGTAILMILIGLSPALGTFIAGVVLADSEYRHELENEIDPFKGLLLGLFFITVGAGMNFALIGDNALLILALVIGLIVVKFFALFAVAKIFRYNNPKTMLFSFALAQGGEFAFVLFNFAQAGRILPTELSQILISVVAISMFLAPIMMIGWAKFVAPIFEKSSELGEPDEIDEEDTDVIIAGGGRVGSVLGRLLKMANQKVVILDIDSEQIEGMRNIGEQVYYGDASRVDLMLTAGADNAKLFIVAIDDREKAIEITETVKKYFPHLTIVARAWDRIHAYQLLTAGANFVQRETIGSAVALGEESLKELGFHQYEAYRIARTFRKVDKNNMFEMWLDYKQLQNDDNITQFREKYRNRTAALEEVVRREVVEKEKSQSSRNWVAAKPEDHPYDDE